MAPDPLTDVDIARFGESVELAAVQLYAAAAGSGKLGPAVAALATAFGAHHADHATALQDILGDQAGNVPNQKVLDTFGPLIANATGEASVLEVVYSFEESAASTHLSASGSLEERSHAVAFAKILPVESQHAVVLGQLLHKDTRAFVPIFETADRALGAGGLADRRMTHDPGRRQLLRVAGAAAIGAASAVVLAACSGGGGGGGGGVSDATDNDITLLRTASSLELLTVDTYQRALQTGLLTDPNVASLAVFFRDHHNDHAVQLQAVTTDIGGEPYTASNPVVKERVVDPTLASLTDQTSVLAFASTLESLAAQTYAYAAGALTLPSLRQTIMTVGGVEARHVTILSGVLAVAQVPAALLPTEDHVAEDAFV